MARRLSAQRVTLIALGVADLERSARFYEALGWRPTQEMPEVKFYRLKGLMLGLTGREALAAEQGRSAAALGTGAMALACNYASPAEVDAAFAAAAAAGATVLRPPRKTGWGGYSGCWADPDGHVWEIAHNPFWPLDADGYLEEPDGA